ncbi:MAG: nitroreductase family protein [Clostridia bacterium]|nr:nitroreductase family protein [Clostridia bacterium]
MNVSDSILKRRSIRKFQSIPVAKEVLEKLVSLGRLYASAANAQPVRFAIVNKKENCDVVFENLNWAMFLPDFTIEEKSRPTAYILLLSEKEKSSFFEFDAGAAATTVMLAAEEEGLSSCCLKIPRQDEMKKVLGLEGYVPVYAIALGQGAIQSTVIPREESQKYSVDPQGNFIVPKFRTEEVLIWSDCK